MIDATADALGRGLEYARRKGLTLIRPLGSGVDGVVLSTDVATAVKSLKYKTLYENELAVYRRLRDRGVQRIGDFWVPGLVRHCDELWVIEIEIVVPPFVLDFASAGLDQNPLDKYSQEEQEEWLASRQELFEERWSDVRLILFAFRRHGIFLVDLKPGNITFAEPEKSTDPNADPPSESPLSHPECG